MSEYYCYCGKATIEADKQPTCPECGNKMVIQHPLYKKGYRDGVRAAAKALRRQMEDMRG